MAAETVKGTLPDKAAVVGAMAEHPAVKALLGWNVEELLDARWDRGELTLTVDWFPSEPRFQLSYHILSHAYKERVRLRAMVSGAAPAVESATSVWPGANYYEREVFDLFGVRFEGHPNLRRILMPDDWEGHPLRKDYPVEGYR